MTPAKPTRIIIDCDPGQDDAIAIMLALASPEALEVLAITAVAGNVPLARTEANARRLVALCGRPDLPVHAGCSRPMLRPLETAEYVHGESGIDGADLPEPDRPLAPAHAIDAIIDILRREPPGTVTLCPTGPLTNIAMALIKAPDIAPRIARIVLMGGAIDHGNVTPAAEFNIYVDPHAASVVFESGVPIVMLGLDVTHKALVTPARIEAIRAIGTRAARSAAGMLEFAAGYDRARYKSDGTPLHDPCVIAWLLDPGLFEGRMCHVEIDTGPGSSIGRTNVDWWQKDERPKNALVIREIDDEGFFGLINKALTRL